MSATKLLILVFAFLNTMTAWAATGRFAMVQYNADLHFNDYGFNMNALGKFADAAVQNRAGVIIFPEGSAYGYADQNQMWCDSFHNNENCVDVNMAAEKIPGGRTEQHWTSYSIAHQVYIVYNLPEINSDGKYYNTTVVSGPQGYLTKYRKRSLYVTDKYYATAGNQPIILNLPFGKYGLAICMDGTYPGILEEYKSLNVDAVIMNMDWDDDPHGSMGARTFFRKRAMRSGLDLLISDVSAWDGSGLYPKTGVERIRNGLAAEAINVDGITYAETSY